MQLQNSPNNIEVLADLEYESCVLYASDLPGEDYHPEYKKNRERFKRMIKTSIRMERYLKRYFKDLAPKVEQKIDWAYYYDKVYKASVYNDRYDWDGDIIELQTSFEGTLDDIFEMGGLDGLNDLNLVDEFTSKDPEAIKALKDYTLQLATDITMVTKERVKQSILRSIALGETQEQATQRLMQVVDDARRAAMIAHTETVRAYSMGKITAGNRLGAKYKVWRDGQPGACKICSNLHTKVVGFNDTFKTITGGEVNFAPAHPWCKCLTKLVLDESFLREDEEIIEGSAKKKSKGGLIWITLKNGRRIPINAPKTTGGNSGFGYNVREVPGLGYKKSNQLVSHEGAPDKARVAKYRTAISKGKKVTPILVVKEGDKWGIEDGKHRFEAFKQLGHKFIPTTQTRSKEYDKATEEDNDMLSQL